MSPENGDGSDKHETIQRGLANAMILIGVVGAAAPEFGPSKVLFLSLGILGCIVHGILWLMSGHFGYKLFWILVQIMIWGGVILVLIAIMVAFGWWFNQNILLGVLLGVAGVAVHRLGVYTLRNSGL